MSSPGLIAFDLDGTLVDSAAGIHASLVAALSGLQQPAPSLEALRGCIGPPLREYLPGLLGWTPGEREQWIEPVLQAFRQHHDREGWRQFQLYEGALPLLQSLESQGWQLHVVTLKPEPLAHRVLQQSGLARHLRSLQAPQPGARLDKAACLQQLRQPGLPVHGYVGDTAGDQRAAAEAGYRFIAAGYGYGSDLVAAHHLQAPLELLRVLAHPA